MYDNFWYFEPTILIWDSYIFPVMSGPLAREGRAGFAVTHLACARIQKSGAGILGLS